VTWGSLEGRGSGMGTAHLAAGVAGGTKLPKGFSVCTTRA
jgi:hypothetical protein